MLVLFLLCALPARADFRDDVGYTVLEAELGAATPDGAGVPVSHVEAGIQIGSNRAWMPDPGNAEFSGKTITDVSGAVPGVYSGHANAVGQNFYGNTISTSPGITTIAAYLADHWLFGGFLRINTTGGPMVRPLSSASRIANHSWIGNVGIFNADSMAQLDWAIATDEMVQTVGFTGNTSNPLLSSAYNVISVNTTHTPTDTGSAPGGGIYTSGRTKPEIVAPANSTSSATPRVASAAALLIDAAHNHPSWSADPAGIATTNRNGDTIYNAERVEVIKAALMAGADRVTGNSTSADITDYRLDVADQTANGLDRRFGAGQLNVYNSYQVVAAGEQNSNEDQAGSAGLIGLTGFDYDPAFGGANAGNTTATYYFPPTSGPVRLTASLVWNLAIDAGNNPDNFDGAATLYDLDLQLLDVTDPGNPVLVAGSASTNENTENLWLLLDGGKDYALQVRPGATQAAFNWDYGLAWQVTPAPPLALNIGWAPQIATQNQFYWWAGLTATGGRPPYTWSLVGGWIPWPMTLNQDGVISGIPANVTTAYFTIQVTDANADTATVQSQITVNQAGYVCGGACHGAADF